MKKPFEENVGDIRELAEKQDMNEENASKALKHQDTEQYKTLTKKADIDFQKILLNFRAVTDRVEDWSSMKKQRACDLKNTTEAALKSLEEMLGDVENDSNGASDDRKKRQALEMKPAMNKVIKKLYANHNEEEKLCPTNVLKKLELSFKANQPKLNPKDKAEHKMMMKYYDQQMKKPFEENVGDIRELAEKQDMNEENASKALKHQDTEQYKTLTKKADIDFQKILLNFRAVTDRVEDWSSMKKQRACDLKNTTEAALKSLEEMLGDVENDSNGASDDRKKRQALEMKPAMNKVIKKLYANHNEEEKLCPTNVLKKLELSFKANQPKLNSKDVAEHKRMVAYYDQQMKKTFEENVLDIGELAGKQDINEENASKAFKNQDMEQYKKLTKEADIEFQKILLNFRAVADRHEDWSSMKKQRACDLQNVTEAALKSLKELKVDVENDIKGESGDRKKHQASEMKPAMTEVIKMLVANDKKASEKCKAK